MRVENYAHELLGTPETPQAEDSLDQKRSYSKMFEDREGLRVTAGRVE